MTLRECRPFRRSDLIGFIRIDGVYHAVQEWTVQNRVEKVETCCGISVDQYPPGREVYDPGDHPRVHECAECLRIAAARFEQSVGYKP